MADAKGMTTPVTPLGTTPPRNRRGPTVRRGLLGVLIAVMVVGGAAGIAFRTPPPPRGGGSTSAVGASLISDAEAVSRVSLHGTEHRPVNREVNQRMDSPADIRAWRNVYRARKEDGQPWTWSRIHVEMLDRVTGNPGRRPRGGPWTTDELVQWAAAKWGLATDIARAVGVNESAWRYTVNGDGGLSWGFTQIKDRRPNEPASPNTSHPGTFPLSRDSMAFNLDYWGATVRTHYEGGSPWLAGGDATGNIWEAVGAWYSGTAGTENDSYVASARRHVASREWDDYLPDWSLPGMGLALR